jgi:hypothetical protein
MDPVVTCGTAAGGVRKRNAIRAPRLPARTLVIMETSLAGFVARDLSDGRISAPAEGFKKE